MARLYFYSSILNNFNLNYTSHTKDFLGRTKIIFVLIGFSIASFSFSAVNQNISRKMQLQQCVEFLKLQGFHPQTENDSIVSFKFKRHKTDDACNYGFTFHNDQHIYDFSCNFLYADSVEDSDIQVFNLAAMATMAKQPSKVIPFRYYDHPLSLGVNFVLQSYLANPMDFKQVFQQSIKELESTVKTYDALLENFKSEEQERQNRASQFDSKKLVDNTIIYFKSFEIPAIVDSLHYMMSCGRNENFSYKVFLNNKLCVKDSLFNSEDRYRLNKTDFQEGKNTLRVEIPKKAGSTDIYKLSCCVFGLNPTTEDFDGLTDVDEVFTQCETSDSLEELDLDDSEAVKSEEIPEVVDFSNTRVLSYKIIFSTEFEMAAISDNLRYLMSCAKGGDFRYKVFVNDKLCVKDSLSISEDRYQLDKSYLHAGTNTLRVEIPKKEKSKDQYKFTCSIFAQHPTLVDSTGQAVKQKIFARYSGSWERDSENKEFDQTNVSSDKITYTKEFEMKSIAEKMRYMVSCEREDDFTYKLFINDKLFIKNKLFKSGDRYYLDKTDLHVGKNKLRVEIPKKAKLNKLYKLSCRVFGLNPGTKDVDRLTYIDKVFAECETPNSPDEEMRGVVNFDKTEVSSDKITCFKEVSIASKSDSLTYSLSVNSGGKFAYKIYFNGYLYIAGDALGSGSGVIPIRGVDLNLGKNTIKTEISLSPEHTEFEAGDNLFVALVGTKPGGMLYTNALDNDTVLVECKAPDLESIHLEPNKTTEDEFDPDYIGVGMHEKGVLTFEKSEQTADRVTYTTQFELPALNNSKAYFFRIQKAGDVWLKYYLNNSRLDLDSIRNIGEKEDGQELDLAGSNLPFNFQQLNLPHPDKILHGGINQLRVEVFLHPDRDKFFTTDQVRFAIVQADSSDLQHGRYVEHPTVLFQRRTPDLSGIQLDKEKSPKYSFETASFREGKVLLQNTFKTLCEKSSCTLMYKVDGNLSYQLLVNGELIEEQQSTSDFDGKYRSIKLGQKYTHNSIFGNSIKILISRPFGKKKFTAQDKFSVKIMGSNCDEDGKPVAGGKDTVLLDRETPDLSHLEFSANEFDKADQLDDKIAFTKDFVLSDIKDSFNYALQSDDYGICKKVFINDSLVDVGIFNHRTSSFIHLAKKLLHKGNNQLKVEVTFLPDKQQFAKSSEFSVDILQANSSWEEATDKTTNNLFSCQIKDLYRIKMIGSNASGKDLNSMSPQSQLPRAQVKTAKLTDAGLHKLVYYKKFDIKSLQSGKTDYLMSCELKRALTYKLYLNNHLFDQAGIAGYRSYKLNKNVLREGQNVLKVEVLPSVSAEEFDSSTKLSVTFVRFNVNSGEQRKLFEWETPTIQGVEKSSTGTTQQNSPTKKQSGVKAPVAKSGNPVSDALSQSGLGKNTSQTNINPQQPNTSEVKELPAEVKVSQSSEVISPEQSKDKVEIVQPKVEMRSESDKTVQNRAEVVYSKEFMLTKKDLSKWLSIVYKTDGAIAYTIFINDKPVGIGKSAFGTEGIYDIDKELLQVDKNVLKIVVSVHPDEEKFKEFDKLIVSLVQTASKLNELSDYQPNDAILNYETPRLTDVKL